MKILIDTSLLDTLHAVRGIGTYTRLLTQYLEQESGLQVVRSGTQAAEKFDPDIIHYPYFDLFFNTLPLVRRRPTVVTIHDVIPLKFPKEYSPGVKGKARFFKQKSALKTVSAVIADSQASKTDIIEHLGVTANRISVIYLAANPSLAKASASAIARARRKYGLPQRYILYVGDINYNKNIPQLIKAARYLPQYTKLVCVGQSFAPQDIPEWHWIETQLALSNVANKVRFVTNVPSGATQDLAAIYSGALCYVQPSLYEGFGLPVLEAMQCQTPVVSTNKASLLEVGGEHVLYAEPEGEDLGEKINQVLAWSKTKRNEVIRAAYVWSQEFSWPKTIKATTEVYKKIK